MKKEIVTTVTSDKQVVAIEKKIAPIVELAKSMTITNEKDMEIATETLSKLNQFTDMVTEEKEKITKPLNEALKVERARWKPIETLYEEAIAHVRGAMSVFRTAEKKRIQDEKDKIANRVGDGKGHLKMETAEKKIDAIEDVTEKVVAKSGSVRFRTDRVLKVTDITAVRAWAINNNDWTLFDLNEKTLLALLKSGIVVAGAEIEEIETPINNR